jgi:hypothetical protein
MTNLKRNMVTTKRRYAKFYILNNLLGILINEEASYSFKERGTKL